MSKKVFKSLLVVGATLILLGVSVFSHQRDQGKLETVFLDVGQGDAILIKTGSGQNILIDGGPNQSVIYALGRHLAFYERTLDLVVLTHPDADHITGLIEVLKRYQVKKILLTQKETTAPEYPVWKKAVEAEGAEVILAQAGQILNFNTSTEDLIQPKITVLYPIEENSLNNLPTNDTSIILRLDHGENSWLLTGDLPSEREDELLAKEKDLLDTDILKVGHHGSKYSSSANFLQAVTPELAIIQVGVNNRFGHPTFAALERLRQAGAEIRRNDQLGDICLVSDGQKVAECQ